jgi:hypothetical protein
MCEFPGRRSTTWMCRNTYHHAWNVLTNLDANGNYILLAAKLPLIHTPPCWPPATGWTGSRTV